LHSTAIGPAWLRFALGGIGAMKVLRSLLSLTLLCGIALPAAPIDVTGSAPNKKTVSATTNDVLLIQTPSGAAAVVQFTAFDSDGAAYRWRFRAAQSPTVQKGTGRVAESYASTPQPGGRRLVTPKPAHDPIVRAGDIKIEWSFGSDTNGYVYFQINRARIQVLSSSAFERDL
jgi:hypothetical protein